MESWGTAVFLLGLALAMVALGVVVSRMVKSVDPNDVAALLTTDETARIYVDAQDDRNEKMWGWRLSALENRVRELEEKARRVETRSLDVELRSLRLYVSHSADKTRIALQTANEALNVARRTDDAVQNVIDSATLRAAVAFHANAIMKDSTPEDDSEEERVAAIEVDCYCVHGNPVEFHYEGGCDV